YPEHEEYLRKNNLFKGIPWGPVAIWASGVKSGELARFFVTLLEDKRPRYFVGNEKLGMAAKYLGARFIPVAPADAWKDRDRVMQALATAEKNAIILYCAGMATEAFAWAARWKRPDLSHLDMGHIFDGAAGHLSRCWLQPTGECQRRDTYFRQYAPVFRGEKDSFGEFPS
ncbi:MAG TPA: hypothetical protein VNM37_04850, partial [Candidatus Dormibacteraeota bacterium]|nr:hypothetical protein [Candidatus Dormibacteraeota bacterium]